MKTVINNTTQIKFLLEQSPLNRDSDLYLYHALLVKLGYSPQNMTVTELLKGIKENTLPHFESVRRTRQKVQEENPSLRGRSWVERQRKARNVRQTIVRQRPAFEIPVEDEQHG